MTINDKEKLRALFARESTIPVGDTGEDIVVNALSSGDREVITQLSSGDVGFVTIAAQTVVLACPVFEGELDSAKALPLEVLMDLYKGVCAFNGIGEDADEEAEKNSESEAT